MGILLSLACMVLVSCLCRVCISPLYSDIHCCCSLNTYCSYYVVFENMHVYLYLDNNAKRNATKF